MSNVFVIAETAAGAKNACAAARTLGDSVTLCVAGAPAITGVADKCVHIDVPAGNIADDAYLSVVAAFDAAGATIALAENTLRCVSLAGRLAAAKGAAAITGVSSFNGAEASSMYFGGVGTRVSKPAGEVAVYILAGGAFGDLEATGTDVVEEAAFQAPAAAVVKTGVEEVPASGVNLTDADIIVSCGRGFSAREDLDGAFELAKKIGAEVGCTRPLAEGEGWFPREAYIGVSGAMLTPKVAVLLGISGQVQHMVGLNTAGTIIAVNKDKNAPVFAQCDYGFVGDLKAVLPELNAAL